MGKRHAPVDERSSAHGKFKRQKLAPSEKSRASPETVSSARQLQFLLSFQQDAPQQLTAGIQSFKNFLNSILYPSDPENVGTRKAILEEFCQSQKPRKSNDDDHIFLESLLQTWSYASQTNNNGLVGAATSVLALLLKLLSRELELREYGVNLCRALLQISQLNLLSKSLSAPKHNDFIISPALRLLTEIVSFDGGLFAKRLYSHRQFTFDPHVIARNISSKGASEDRDPAKPSVRSNAIKYLLANFRYQNEGAKIDIIKNGNISRALFSHMHDDSPEMVRNILQTIKTSVVLDDSVLRSSKSYLFDDRNLASIVSICRRRDVEEQSTEPGQPFQQVAYDLLLILCTTPNLGVHRRSQGWYPPSTVRALQTERDVDEEASVDLGLDGIDWYDSFVGRVHVRNGTLASFIQVLRPYANELEQQLLLAIFKACPELVADYFFKNTKFSFDPKLTATWIGYSSFLFSTVQLPIPQYFGMRGGFTEVPPPISIVVESILPQPLTQKALTKCLNQQSDLISFFATRILVVALQKLKRVLTLFHEAALTKGSLWAEAAGRLQADVCRRCPPMKDLIALFRKTTSENVMQYEAITRLLSLYYDSVPRVALEENFDISVALTTALENVEKQTEEDELVEMRMLSLGHLLKTARHTQDMQWWKKPDTLQFTPFTTLLKLAAISKRYSADVMELLESIVEETAILQMKTEPPALVALLASLKLRDGECAPTVVFEFLDSCLTRFVKRPIKYEDDSNTLMGKDNVRKPIDDEPFFFSLSLMTLMEQIPFLEKAQPDAISAVAQWLSKYLGFLAECGEYEAALSSVLNGMVESLFSKSAIESLKNALSRTVRLEDHLAGLQPETEAPEDDKMDVELPAPDFTSYWEELRSPQENDRHPGLNRWSQKEVEEAIEEQNISDLLLCLSSSDGSIRLQAFQNVKKFIPKLAMSTYTERDQISLLLNELLETISQQSKATPLTSYLATAFTTAALKVLTDPSHIMYAKLNRFLNRGPAWTVSKLPSYWTTRILLNPPDTDDAHWQEVSWLLDWLFDGLRKPDDLNILRTCGTFERVLALYGLACVPRFVMEKILKIVGRTTTVEGGSTTLVTRVGFLSWVDGVVANKKANVDLLTAMKQRVWETCDQERVREWSAGEVERAMDNVES